jgi:hypothetical protein
MCDPFRIGCEQAVKSLVTLDCSKCVFSRERMLTCGGNEGHEKDEVAAVPNSHMKDSMNGRGRDATCGVGSRTLDEGVR